MKKSFSRPFRFGIVYSVVVVLAITYVLLDTFVIPRGIRHVMPETVDENLISAEGFTDYSYKDENISIVIKGERDMDTQIYLVYVTLSGVDYLKTAFAENTFGRNIKETTSEMAEASGAILAINGDYYGFRDDGYVMRNGVTYRSSLNGTEDLAILSDGSFFIFDEFDYSMRDIEKMGARQVFSFGPGLVKNGEINVSENTEVERAKVSNPRTAIGMISPLEYLFIVSDGRTHKSSGLTLYQLAEKFIEKGCTEAYNLDGGGSTTLWFNGDIVNIPTNGNSFGEREQSDIVYIGY